MPNDNLKAPSQIFRWFEKMKSNYEHTVTAVLNKFEQHNEKQQARLDLANQQHIENLTNAHQQHIEHSQATIAQLQSDINYYKQQISQQHSTIEQLNARYDAVMTTFLEQKKRDIDIKAIFDQEEEETIELPLQPKVAEECVVIEQENTIAASPSTSEQVNTNPNEQDIELDTDLAERLYQDALSYRNNEDFEQAVPLFKEASKLGCVKSRGALGRAYFLAEGVNENPSIGLAWLISAADMGLPQAIKRVEHFQQSDPELFELAQAVKQSL